jgi:thiol-disulfide isomerase/thioredoxin
MEPLYKGAREKVVINLTPHEFESRVIKSGDQGIWMVQFYAHWCDVCKEMAPLYNHVAQALDGVVKVAAVNLGDEEDTDTDSAKTTVSEEERKAAAKRIADKYNVAEYPHILLFGHDRSKPILYDNGDRKDMQSLVQTAMDAVIQTITYRVNNGVMPPQPDKKKNSKNKSDSKSKKNSNSKRETVGGAGIGQGAGRRMGMGPKPACATASAT